MIDLSVRATSALAAITVLAACGIAPQSGVGDSPSVSPSATFSAAPSPAPSTSPPASPSMVPAAAYLDDRSTPELTVRSYYDAIGRRQFLRAYVYREASASLTSFESFAKDLDSTTSAQVEIGKIGGNAGAGQLFWSVPAAVFATTTSGAQAFAGCFTVHLGRPEIQSAPPFRPMAIQASQLTEVASASAARSALSSVCNEANATVLPWPTSSTAIDAAVYVDDRSTGETVLRSLYNSVNRREYARAYAYWEPGASQLGAFETFAAGFAKTKSVVLVTKPGFVGAAAGSTYYSVPAVITVTNMDGTTATFSGCYTLRLGSPYAQATPPFRPLAIQSAQVAPAPSGANADDLLNAGCPAR